MKPIFIFSIILILTSCKRTEKNSIASQSQSKNIYHSIYGNWVGNFVADSTQGNDENFVYSNKINLIIKKIDNNIVYGQSIVAGNKRTIKGTIEVKNDSFKLHLNEPGNSKHNGKFEFTIKNGLLSGKWIALDTKASVLTRNYELTKVEFKYNPNLMLPKDRDYIDYYSLKIDSTKETIDEVEETYYDEYYRTASTIITRVNSSTTLLKEEDVKNLKKLELEILRNTIFARHGYSFKKKSYRQFFDPVDWYIPISENVTGELTPIEKLNINLLERFEKYANDNYDSFGR